MKRYLSWICVLILCIPFLSVSASASAWTSSDVDDVISGIDNISNEIYSFFEQWDNYFRVADIKSVDKDGVEIYITQFEQDLREVWDFVFGYFTVLKYPIVDPDGNTAFVSNFMFDLYSVKNLFWSVTKDSIETIKSYLATIRTYTNKMSTTISNWFTAYDADMTSIINFLKEIVQSSSSSNDQVTDVENDFVQDSTEASEILDIMDDVTKPDVGELEDLSDISDYVNAGDVSTLAACLAPFFQSAVFLPCIMLSLIFMLVAYVLYGKR